MGQADSTVATRLIRAMRGVAGSVSIISARGGDGTNYAMTATSPTSLSMDPPSMIACINRSSSIARAFAGQAEFCISVLHVGQLELARLCSAPVKVEDRFALGDWAYTENGTPYLADAQAAIHCQLDKIIDYATHSIIVGRVVDVYACIEVEALLYANGQYCGVRALQ